ncbi:uncharacterized protein BCR38DRAFT_194872 [Pseudomassariella vexata]|uniref:Uncharacterized protein n=1 Tax=Pseudomassariella vexata TaxID=1141098 RepID=A0A1Y2E171_9PEZI|nr:uncharacterized protein BCR38DRAFT_194872 [Pseudomassariella vexata]ORY65303.1 hypothetical protein BCR38DRAFT_194872 [Pseudomassariella vexata]
MATRYTVEALLHLRESPLCTKPSSLPPAEEWMGPPPETFRNSQSAGKTGPERTRTAGDNSLLDNTNKRPGVERHVPRNSANPADIVLGPPRTTFSSATISRGSKPFDNEKTLKESDARDRFASLRTRNGDGDRDRERDRDGRNNFRRRGDAADQDSDGWSTVKPRKSFGHEGAERFHGRMGERPERPAAAERRPRDSHDDRDRDNGDRPPRRSNFGEFSRDKDGDDGERPRRNGLNKNRTDQPTWSRGNTAENEATPAPAPVTASTRERFDRAKSWRERGDRERDRDDHHDDRARRWDNRDQRQEREPEWLDEPADGKNQTHTEEDFKKFMESMKAGKTAKAAPIDTSSHEESLEPEKSKVKSASAIDLGPDKFFANFASTPSADMSNPLEGPKETAVPKPKTGSRFQNFFSSQEDRRQTEPTTPASSVPIQEPNPLLAFAGAGAGASAAMSGQPGISPVTQADPNEKVAFQALLQKLKGSKLNNTPPSGGFPVPTPPSQDMGSKSSVASPGGPFSPFHHPRDEPLIRGPPPPSQQQEMHAPRPQQTTAQPPPPPMRTDQMMHELLGHHMRNQAPIRNDQNHSRNSNSNAEFLMTLMQSARGVPEPPRTEQLIRMPQPSRPAQIPQTPDRESDYQRERSSSHHQGRPQGLPSFFDVPQLRHEQDNRRQQPTQILQRQGPPGLDQMHPNTWMQGANQQLPPGPGRPMIPPPGLAGNPRNGPMPGMFPPNFPNPMGGFAPPDGMIGHPRNMAPPPGFFGGPPGFLPPPGIGPEALAYGFDGRGMPPPSAGGAFRRN